VTIPVVLVKKQRATTPSTTIVTTTTTTTTASISTTTTRTTTTISRKKPSRKWIRSCFFFVVLKVLVLAEYDRSYLTDETVWKQNGRTVFIDRSSPNEFSDPGMLCGLAIDDDQTIYVSSFTSTYLLKRSLNDDENQLIYQNTEGGFGGGYRDFILDENNTIILCSSITSSIIRISIEHSTAETIISDTNCYGIAIDNERNIYFSNDAEHVVKKWDSITHEISIIAGGNGRGNGTDQLAHPTSIFIDDKQSLYISDFGNRRIMKGEPNSNEFRVVASDRNGLEQLESVGSIFVDHFEYVYVSDWATHRIVRCHERQQQQKCRTIAGGNDAGNQPNQLHYPAGIAMDKYGHLYVADRLNYRVQQFEIEFY